MVFSVIDDCRYSDDVVLLGSNALKSLNAVCDFTTDTMYIDSIFPIRMYTDGDDIENKKDQIESDYLGLRGIEVKFDRSIIIPANGSKCINIRLPKNEARCMRHSYVFFTKGHVPYKGLMVPDMIIDKEFPWHKNSIEVSLTNNTSRILHLQKGETIAVLKPMTSRSLTKKLDCYRGYNPMHNHSENQLALRPRQRENFHINSIIEAETNVNFTYLSYPKT